MTKPRPMDVGLALLLGISFPWVLPWLISHTFLAQASIAEPLIVLIQRQYGWNLDQIQHISRIFIAVLAMPTDGLVGLVLGLFLTQQWFFYWLTFLGAVLITLLVSSFRANGVSEFLFTMLLPEFWLTLLATLLFTFIGYRIRKFCVSCLARA